MLSDGTPLLPLPELDAATGTLAQRRGKTLPSLKPVKKPSLTNLSIPQGATPRSPWSPDTPSSLAQRFVGFMRLSPCTDADDPDITPEYEEDPFARGPGLPSFFDDGYLFDRTPGHHPDLYDISVYRPRAPPPEGAHYQTEKCAKHGRARLYIGVSSISSRPSIFDQKRWKLIFAPFCRFLLMVRLGSF